MILSSGIEFSILDLICDVGYLCEPELRNCDVVESTVV